MRALLSLQLSPIFLYDIRDVTVVTAAPCRTYAATRSPTTELIAAGK